MGLLDRLRNPAASVVVDTVTGALNGAADIADRFIQTKDERAEFQLALKEHELKVKAQAMDADNAILTDRQSARAMAGVHGNTQRQVAKIFIIAYFIVLFGDLGFIAMLVYLALGNPTFRFPEWLIGLIGTMLGSVTTGMSLKLDTILGFLFGGSAGGDDSARALSETLRGAANTTEQG